MDKRIMYAEGELDEVYFCRERFQLYLDLLSLEKKDVGELTWYFVSAFWPEQFKMKSDYINEISALLTSDYYDVSL